MAKRKNYDRLRGISTTSLEYKKDNAIQLFESALNTKDLYEIDKYLNNIYNSKSYAESLTDEIWGRNSKFIYDHENMEKEIFQPNTILDELDLSTSVQHAYERSIQDGVKYPDETKITFVTISLAKDVLHLLDKSTRESLSDVIDSVTENLQSFMNDPSRRYISDIQRSQKKFLMQGMGMIEWRARVTLNIVTYHLDAIYK